MRNAYKLDPKKSPESAKKIQRNPSIDNYFKVLGMDSKSVAFGRGGSSPPTGTIYRKVAFIATFRRFGRL